MPDSIQMKVHGACGWWASSMFMVYLATAGGCFQDQVMPPDSQGNQSGTSQTSVVTGSSATDSNADSSNTNSGVGSQTSGGSVMSSAQTSELSTESTSIGQTTGSSSGAGHDTTTGEPILGVDELIPGDLVVTEVMSNPHCGADNCEWIEVLNATDSWIDLQDLYVQDNNFNSGNQGRVTINVIVEPGKVAIICRTRDDSWPYRFQPDAVYGPNPGLDNGSPDRVVLVNSGGIIDQTAIFLPGDRPQGVTWSLSSELMDSVNNDNSSSWCGATTPLPLTSQASREYGTPGELNPPC